MATIFGFGEEVAVINNELLRLAVEEQAPAAIQVYGPDSGAKDSDVQSLRLDLRRILKIDNLWAFTSLRKLQLDNNLIETIENLDSLVHLEWLDLSFNQIEVISGLDKLVKLKDLTLHQNRIAKLEKLDNLTALEVLSVGNNQLDTLQEVLYLRQFKQLSCLNAAGNPMCTDPSYEMYAVAFLPKLRFLDYRRIAQETRASALITYQDQLEVVMAQELSVIQADQVAETARAKEQLYTDACVPGLEGRTFFATMLDPSLRCLSVLPGVPSLLAAFEERLCQQVDDFATLALAKAKSRQEEGAELEQALATGIAEVNAEGAQLIDEFIDLKTETLAKLAELDDEEEEVDVQPLLDALASVKHKLMEHEIDLVAQVEETQGTFERNYADMVGSLKEQAQTVFADLRQMEEETQAAINDVAMAYLDALAKGEEDKDLVLSVETQEVLRDKPALATAMTTAHDNHMLAIDTAEDAVSTSATAELTSLMDKLTTTEVKRNRARVAEISKFHDYHRDDLLRIESELM